MGELQRGLSTFAMLVVLVLAVAAGYYAFKGVSLSEDAPSCKGAQSACMQKCRRSTTDAPAAQVCQDACQREAASCEREQARK